MAPAAKPKRARRTPPSSEAIDEALRRLRAVLTTRPILMLHDAALPSVTTIIAEEPIAGGWWGHPKGHLVFEVLSRIEDEVAWPKLVRAKVTLVQRELWPALIATCRGEEPWQLRGLPRDARELLDQIAKSGSARTDHLREEMDGRIVGRAVDQLERRLLVMSTQVHTSSGKHARELSTWQRWQTRSGLAGASLPPVDRARAAIASAIEGFDADGDPLLPWCDGGG